MLFAIVNTMIIIMIITLIMLIKIKTCFAFLKNESGRQIL